MNILVLNGSPRKNGNTAIMIDEFRKRVKQHTVHVLPVGSMNVKGCKGCRYCYKHNGECIQQDDMNLIYEELKKADMVIFASPIYWFDISSQLKAVIDRMYALGSIGFAFDKTALFLNAGADHVFDGAIHQYKMMTNYLKWNDMGMITIANMTEKGSMKNADLTKLDQLTAVL